MFSWFRKPAPFAPPPSLAGNPGMGAKVSIAFSNAQRSWHEEDDLVRSLASVLKDLGHDARARRDWIELGDGFTLQPQIAQFQPLEPSGVKTVSTIQVAHPTLVPGGVFEYQHASGANIPESFASGFRNWAMVDLPVFLEADLERPDNTMMMDFTKGAAKFELSRNRRVVLGPTQHLAQSPLAADAKDEHPFCLCCLFTNSIEAFREQIAKDEFVGIRLFALREKDGSVRADCRVNGIDWTAGAEALALYAGTWPDRGFEFRKQYVAIRSR